MIKVFYDGKCGMCAQEIAYFRQRKPLDTVVWCDIAHDPEVLSHTGLFQSEALMFMHVEDGDGQMQVGVNAFICMWGQFRGWNMLARTLSLPGINRLSMRLYKFFAKRRFESHAHCRTAAIADGTNAEALLNQSGAFGHVRGHDQPGNEATFR